MVYIKRDCKQAEYRHRQSKSPPPCHDIPLQNLKVRGWCVASVRKISTPMCVIIIIIIIIIIGIQPLGRFGQRPELRQATGMAPVRCILGKFLRVACHCFPPRLDVPTFATRCLHTSTTTQETLVVEGGTVGENVVP